MSVPRVFVVSEPLKWDPVQRAHVRSVNLNPARKFGDLVFLLPPNNEGSADPAVVVETLHQKLAEFTCDDYLLPVGSPLYIAWAAAIAAGYSDGLLTLLHWQREDRCYVPVKADLVDLSLSKPKSRRPSP